jgi:hypothetical protein
MENAMSLPDTPADFATLAEALGTILRAGSQPIDEEFAQALVVEGAGALASVIGRDAAAGQLRMLADALERPAGLPN